MYFYTFAISPANYANFLKLISKIENVKTINTIQTSQYIELQAGTLHIAATRGKISVGLNLQFSIFFDTWHHSSP